MKLSETTQKIIKNFSEINKNILFKEGNILTTRSDNRCLVARATLEDTFPSTFGIYDLSRFLNTLSLFKDPDLSFSDKLVYISDTNHKIQYKVSPQNLLNLPKSDNIDLPSVDLEFTVTADNLNSVIKAANVMRMPYIAFIGNRNSNIKLVALDKEDKEGDKYEIDLEHTSDKNFVLFLDLNNIRMIVVDYIVRICKNRIVEFGSDKLTYWVAADNDSVFQA